MKIPVIKGIIDRRILVNYTVDPEIISTIIPPPFKPIIFRGKAMAGICLIRLKEIRPKGFPKFIGIGSENGAHRIAVEWMEGEDLKKGVYIPRRDTSSILNSLAGGRFFPGKHTHAKFDVSEDQSNYSVSFISTDGIRISVKGKKTDKMPEDSIFFDLKEASVFYENGSVGFSPGENGFDGLELKTANWKVEPLNISEVSSSFFENKAVFPTGSVQFDHALLMTDISHEWHSVKQKSFLHSK